MAQKVGKPKAPKEIHEWKLLTRKNMGAKANSKTVVTTQYLKTFRERKFVEEWVKENGTKEMVYLTEHWINGKRVCGKHTIVMCDICNWKNFETRSFIDKWTWNEKKRIWHRSFYVHSSEKL